MWGVYEYDESVHVVPCGEDGVMRFPHVGWDFCFCHPDAICFGEDGRYIVEHHEVH